MVSQSNGKQTIVRLCNRYLENIPYTELPIVHTSMSLKYLRLKIGGNDRKSIKVTFGSFLREVKEKNNNNKQILNDFIKL